jgi:glycosyltransferase involved in cell wall biosynthesis
MFRRLSILQIISKPSISSGGPKQAFQLAQGLAERGHRVSFVCRPLSRGLEEVRKSGVGLVQLGMRNEFDLRSVMELYRLMKRERTEVVHVHKGLAHTLAYPAAVLAGVPVFVVNRGVSFPLDRFNRIKYRWRGVSKIVAVSEQVKQVLIDSGGIEPHKIKVIYGGVNLGMFDWRIKPDGIMQEFGIQPETTVIGVIANIRRWKGHMLLLQAARQLVNLYPKTIFLIVGRADNSLAEQLKRTTVELGLTNKVIFTGYRRDVPQLLAAMDFTLNCSTSGEGLTGALRESLAMKKPAVATDIGGNSELIINGQTGLLIPPNQPQALVEAMKYLVENPAERRRMGEAGYEMVKAGFTDSARISQMEELYNELLANQ